MTCDSVSLLSQCKSGFGYMVYDIAHSLTEYAEVDGLLFNYRNRAFEQGGITFKSASIELFMLNVFLCSSPFIPFKLWRKYRMRLRTIIRLIYCWLITGYYYKLIKSESYDIVHIHGCGFTDELWMDVCRRCNTPFVVTLHGLNSFSESVNLEPAGKRYERDFLARVVNGEFPITVISSGIKQKTCDSYLVDRCDHIHVVCNSFSFGDFDGTTFDVRKKYGIPENSKIILYVGNISRNKNQEQLIRAIDLLPNEIMENVYVLFLGRNIESEYNLDDIVSQSKYHSHLILCGNVDKKDIPSYYLESDGVVLLSYAEGFGLSLIEGMHFGLPCMTFEDLDAYEDIYDESAVIGLDNRTDKCVAEGIERLINRNWNHEAIKKYSSKFNRSAMASNYLNVYKKIAR